MTLEQAIHERWVSFRPLECRVPELRVFTGTAAGDVTLPYATINRTATKFSERTSDNEIVEVVLRFDVWSALLDEAQEIDAAIHERFEGARFDFDGGSCLAMTRIGREQQQGPTGDWRLSADYRAITLSERGDFS